MYLYAHGNDFPANSDLLAYRLYSCMQNLESVHSLIEKTARQEYSMSLIFHKCKKKRSLLYSMFIGPE